MTDDLIRRANYALEDMQGRVDVGKLALFADCIARIEELEAKLSECEARLEKAVEILTVIDALDPEGFVNGCSQSALIGLVSRMGAIARTTLAAIQEKENK